MAFDFDVLGWEDKAGHRYDGKPDDISQVWSEFVHAYNPSTGEHEYFWAHSDRVFDSWDDWLDYIHDIMDMYGLEMAS